MCQILRVLVLVGQVIVVCLRRMAGRLICVVLDLCPSLCARQRGGQRVMMLFEVIVACWRNVTRVIRVVLSVGFNFCCAGGRGNLGVGQALRRDSLIGDFNMC